MVHFLARVDHYFWMAGNRSISDFDHITLFVMKLSSTLCTCHQLSSKYSLKIEKVILISFGFVPNRKESISI